MAYQYLIVCLFDFLLGPIANSLISHYWDIPYQPWDPLTLKESAFYHVSMMAIVGVSAWSRGQEKIKALELTQPDTTNN